MSGDLTKKLTLGDSDKLTLILTTVQNLDKRSIAAETQFGTVEARMERLELRLDNVDSRLDNVDLRLQSVEQKVEQRLYDTRPMWHKLDADIGELQKSQQRLEKGQEVLNDAIRKINSDIHAIDVRLSGLEADSKQRNSST